MRAGSSIIGTCALAALLGLAAVGTCANVNAAPNDQVYTVGNYPVDAEAKNAVAAKKKALADGQQAAFRSLLKRVVPVTSYDRIKRLSALKSADFFAGVSVRSERNSRTRYIASLDFSFRPDSVRAVLRQEGIPFVDEQARKVIVVPVVLNAQGRLETGAGGRTWRGIWKSLDLKHTLTPITLESANAKLNADIVAQLLQDGAVAARLLADEYGEPYVIVAIAEPDVAAKRLNVTLVGTDAVGPVYLARTYRVFDGDTGYSMELAAVVGQGVLEGRWKAHKLGQTAAAQGPQIALQAQYSSFAEWRDMRQRLLRVPGVNDVRIGAESAQAANLTLRHPGGANGLAGALYSQGLALTGGAGGLVLRFGY